MTKTNRKSINLALQGGGAHGAFTWGVLDYLLECGKLDISAISGTSAGAMNAAALVSGYVENGPDGARECLDTFWERMADLGKFSPIKRSPIDLFMGNWSLESSLSYRFFNTLTHSFSPYQLNPLNVNPLLEILKSTVNFENIRHCDAIRLFISATNVETGRVRVFDSKSLTPEMVMASACLPMVFQAVEIDGVPYWDGGYMGNPALHPFHHNNTCEDIVIVQINPIVRKGTPKTAQEIQNRMNEIAFNSALLKELRSIDFVARLIEKGVLNDDHYNAQRVHIIENQDKLIPMGASSKMNTERDFLMNLKNIGRESAERWLADKSSMIGKKSSVDIREMFQGIGATTS